MRLRVYIECIGILLDDDEGNRPVIHRCYDVKAIGIVEIIIPELFQNSCDDFSTVPRET